MGGRRDNKSRLTNVDRQYGNMADSASVAAYLLLAVSRRLRRRRDHRTLCVGFCSLSLVESNENGDDDDGGMRWLGLGLSVVTLFIYLVIPNAVTTTN